MVKSYLTDTRLIDRVRTKTTSGLSRTNARPKKIILSMIDFSHQPPRLLHFNLIRLRNIPASLMSTKECLSVVSSLVTIMVNRT